MTNLDTIRIPIIIDLTINIAAVNPNKTFGRRPIEAYETKPQLEPKIVLEKPRHLPLDEPPAEIIPRMRSLLANKKSELNCDYMACKFVAISRASLAAHKRWHYRKSSLQSKLDDSRKAEDALIEKDILDCPNPRCIRRRKFVKNTGFKANGEEWCCKRCFDDVYPPKGGDDE